MSSLKGFHSPPCNGAESLRRAHDQRDTHQAILESGPALLRQHHQDGLDYLTATCAAAIRGESPPSLLRAA